jgi:hypothetical protein
MIMLSDRLTLNCSVNISSLGRDVTYLDFTSRVRVTKTKLGDRDVSLLHTSAGK